MPNGAQRRNAPVAIHWSNNVQKKGEGFGVPNCNLSDSGRFPNTGKGFKQLGRICLRSWEIPILIMVFGRDLLNNTPMIFFPDLFRRICLRMGNDHWNGSPIGAREGCTLTTDVRVLTWYEETWTHIHDGNSIPLGVATSNLASECLMRSYASVEIGFRGCIEILTWLSHEFILFSLFNHHFCGIFPAASSFVIALRGSSASRLVPESETGDSSPAPPGQLCAPRHASLEPWSRSVFQETMGFCWVTHCYNML